MSKNGCQGSFNPVSSVQVLQCLENIRLGRNQSDWLILVIASGLACVTATSPWKKNRETERREAQEIKYQGLILKGCKLVYQGIFYAHEYVQKNKLS